MLYPIIFVWDICNIYLNIATNTSKGLEKQHKKPSMNNHSACTLGTKPGKQLFDCDV